MDSLCPYLWFRPSKSINAVGGSLTARMASVSLEKHEVSDRLVMSKLALALQEKALFGRALCIFLVVFREIADLWPKAMNKDKRLTALDDAVGIVINSRIPHFLTSAEFFLGGSWKEVLEEVSNSKEVSEYVKELNRLAELDPILLVPYAYHLGLALMSGGQMIMKATERAFGKNNVSSRIFKFSNVPSKSSFKKELKRKIDELTFENKEEEEEFLMQSVKCFQMNDRMVRNLGERVGLIRIIRILAQSFWFNLFLALLYFAATYNLQTVESAFHLYKTFLHQSEQWLQEVARIMWSE